MIPVGFIPSQDKGYFLVNVTLPPGASVQRTSKVMATLEKRALEETGVAHTVSISGQSIVLGVNAPNWGSIYVMLDGFEKRRAREQSADAIAGRLRKEWQSALSDEQIDVFGPPPVDGLGSVAGFKQVLEDRGDYGLNQLE